MGFFPVDDEALNYLRQTGRPEKCSASAAYCKAQDSSTNSTQTRCSVTHWSWICQLWNQLAGPKRPQDRVNLSTMQSTWQETLRKPPREASNS